MTPSHLDIAIQSYDTALSKLTEVQGSPSLEQVLAVLNARNAVQNAIKTQGDVSLEYQQKIVTLDTILKQQAERICNTVDLTQWRASLDHPLEAWWWRLDAEAPPHKLDRIDWLWKGLTVMGWTANLSLLADIVTRFVSAGTGFAGIAAVTLPSILTLLKAKSELTKAGQEGFDDLLNRLRVPFYYHEEARLVSTGLLFLFLVGFRGLLPLFSDFYNQQGVEAYRAGYLASAEAKYEQALSLNPDNLKAYYNLAVVYEDLQEFDKARKQYQFAVKGDFIKAQNNLARLQILNKKPALAIPLLFKGLEQLEGEPLRVRYNLLKNLGWAFIEDGRETEAESILQGAIQLAKTPEGLEQIGNRGSAHCLLAQSLQKQKRGEEAIEQWQYCCQHGSMFNLDEDRWLSLAHKELRKVNKLCEN